MMVEDTALKRKDLNNLKNKQTRTTLSIDYCK